MLARIAEAAEDYKTMQTYMRLIVKHRIENPEISSSINDGENVSLSIRFIQYEIFYEFTYLMNCLNVGIPQVLSYPRREITFYDSFYHSHKLAERLPRIRERFGAQENIQWITRANERKQNFVVLSSRFHERHQIWRRVGWWSGSRIRRNELRFISWLCGQIQITPLVEAEKALLELFWLSHRYFW